MTIEWNLNIRNERLRPYYILGLGLLFLIVILGESLYVLFLSNPLGMVWIAGLVTSLPFNIGIVYVGLWLPDGFISASRFKRIGFWSLGGLGVFFTLNIIIMITMPPDSALRLISWGRWAATIGAGVGLLVGVFEARGIEREVQSERERVRAKEAEAKEELFTYLNATLRHEVLNTANVITGRADLVLAEYDGDGEIPEHLEIIKSHSRQMEAVIEDVRVLLRASQNKIEPGQVDIVSLLTKEIDILQNTHQSVAIETSLPEHAIAEASVPLRRAFANLLWNAVEHNDSDTPQIEVTVRRKPDTVVVRIGDNGPGIPDAEQESLFDQDVRSDENHGLGLPLTQILVDNYDGRLELSETGSNGTVFTLTLPRASEPAHKQDKLNV
jgi:signal transduction histidine kinase